MSLQAMLRAAAAGTAMVFALAVAGGAHAIGSGDATTTEAPECKTGQVWDEDKEECVDAEALLDDDALYEQGSALALAGKVDKALPILNAIADRDDAMVLTMTGFALRKSGEVDAGIALYHQALALEPDNLNTIEYLGEGYVAAGKLSLAMTQLQRLKGLCGTDCEHYRKLADVIGGSGAW